MSKVLITLGNYVDSVDVFFDEQKLKVKKLSTTGKATYECSADCGAHTLSVIKRSKTLEKGWGKTYFFTGYPCFPEYRIGQYRKLKRKGIPVPS